MGVDSVLPEFRGRNQGMWRAYPELGKQRIDFTEIMPIQQHLNFSQI